MTSSNEIITRELALISYDINKQKDLISKLNTEIIHLNLAIERGTLQWILDGIEMTKEYYQIILNLKMDELDKTQKELFEYMGNLSDNFMTKLKIELEKEYQKEKKDEEKQNG